MAIHARSRLAAALASLCLIVTVPAAAGAVNQVMPGDPGGGMICNNCGANKNATSQTGNATGGSVQSNGNGNANVSMSYATPNDGSNYAGSVSIIVQDANGNYLYNYSGGITDNGNGGTMYTGLDDIYVPVGATISIYLSETNSAGRSFNAGWGLRNYRP